MATYNFTDGSISGMPKIADTLPNTTGTFVRSNIVDCSLQNLDAGDGDVGQVINIPADTFVMRVLLRTITAETANGTVDLGHGGNADVWGDALAIDAAAGRAEAAVAADHTAPPCGVSLAVASGDQADVFVIGNFR